MKKMNRAISVVLIILTAIAGFTCKPGLGSQIDILPPSGEIIYPDAGETPIRGSFILRGTAKDDEGVRAVSIVFENIETKDRTRSFPASLSKPGADSTEWTVSIDNEPTGTEAPPHELVKIYPIPDGEYTAIVTVTDNGGKPSTFTKNYKIDNTPPVFIVQRPSTVAGKDETPVTWDGYGAIFSVVGQAGERNTVEKLNVHIPGTPPIDMINMFVGNTINAQVAVSKVVSGSETDLLYKLQEQDKTKPIRSQLYLYDNARKYTGGGATGEGNKAEWYYKWTEIYTDVIAKGYTPEVISDYFAGKKGSAKNEHDQKILALRNDTTALAKLKEKMIKMSDMRSTFKLDPSKSPGFKVIGSKHLSTTPAQIKGETPTNASAILGQASAMMFKAGGDAPFVVELIPNKDNIPLVGGSNAAAYNASEIKIVLYKWKPNDNAFDIDHPITLVNFESFTDAYLSSNPDLIRPEGDKLRIQCTFPSAQGEGIYAVDVKGHDTIKEDTHKFVAYDDSNTANGMYAIKFYSVGGGPRIRPIRPQGFKKANAKFVLAADVTGIDTTTGHVYCNIGENVNDSDIELKKASAAANDPRYEVEVEIVEVSGKYVIKWKDPAGVSKQKELPVGFSDGTHIIHFLGKAGSGSTDTDKTDFTFDTKAPTVEITSPDLSRSQSGDFTMRGSVIDTPSGVKSIKYIVGKQKPSDPDDITTKPVETSTEWKPLSLSGDTWAIGFTGTDNITQKLKAQALGKMVEGLAPGVELYDIPIFFLVEDKAGETTQKGNIDIIRRIIRVDPNGDIPEVTVLTPEANKVLGGTITISGTVSVPNPAAGQVGSVWIQITDKTKTGQPDKPDFGQSAMFGGTNWCPSGGKQLTSYTVGSPYWSQEINSGKEFNPSGDTPRTIWFRLRGKNANGVEGRWTSPVKIKIDKTAPTITGMKVATSGNINTPIPSGPLNPENQTYVSNMWIKGDTLYLCAELAHSAGIEMISISGNYTSPTSLVGDSQITGYKIHNQQCFVQNGNNYKMQIPLKTTANPGSNNGFTINITIKAKKLDPTASDLTASNSFSFKYDNSAPTAVFGTKIASSGTVTVSGTSFTDPALIGKTNIDASTTKFFASGEDIAIIGFDRSIGKVTLASAPAHPTKGYLLYSPIEYLRPDGIGKVGVFGAAYDVGAGVEKVKVKYNNVSTTEIVLESPSGVQTDVGNGDVNFVTWKGVIDVGSFADGKGKIIITPIDRANNEHAPIEVPVKLKKNSLKISSVELGTDINRNGTIANVGSTVETKTLAPAYDADKPNGIDSEKYDWHGKADADAFRFKNATSHIKVGISGGNGTKKYTLKCLTNGQDVCGLTALPSNGVILLNAADFTKIDQSDDLSTTNPKKRKLLLTLWDSASGLTCGTDTWKAELTFDVIVDTKDRIAPTNEIDPFKWISENDNSLYGNSRKNGHIEIGTDLPNNFSASTGLMDKDDKVSGKISLTGTAHDDQVITEIWAKIDGFTFTGGTTGTGADAGYTKLAAFTAGSFSDAGDFNTHGWHFSIVSNDFSVETGHTVKWKLDWNTAKITDGVGTDKNITIKIKDTDQTNTAVKSRKVDVVPFITGLERPDTYNTNRSSSGAYNLLRGDKVTVEGFNLGGAGATVKAVIPNGTATGSEALISGNKFTLPAAAKSGLIVITVDPDGTGPKPAVEAINNLTNNGKPYNRQEIANRLETQYWTDDLTIDVWKDDEDFAGSNNPKYPSMAMGSNGDLYAAYSNYSEAKVYYSKLGTSIKTQVFAGYDPPEEAAISVTGTATVNILYSANYHGGNDYDWDKSAAGAGGLYCYDAAAPVLMMKAATMYDPAKTGQFHRFELFYHNKQLQQFKNFRISRGNNNRIHVAYYDTLSYSIKYATVINNAQGDINHEYPWINLDGNSDADDTGSYTGGSSAVLMDGATGQFEDGLRRTGGTAEYCAIALDSSNRPVVVYADVDTGTLRLARANAETPTAATNWKVQKVLPAGDANTGRAVDYFAAQFDSAGHLHIVFRNTKGQICYVKSTNANAGASAYTFEKSVVVAENGSRVELTMDGTTPYVAYLSKTNAYDGIQIAYYDTDLVKTWKPNGSANEKGAWNIMTAAMKHRAGDARACIAVAPSAVTDWKAAVGYTPGSVYRVVKYIK